ncbi:S8 family peptidase [Lonepinella koalarum]|uniref:Subtilase family protein n=1 Tax=Lonepinella koalarum TaxID=53417 RepID=A0A4R1L0M2_9PAST|nr:S8 family peptidase [Lonepinella koalarum]MDH2927647.1 serine protease [Lonepinella koalarum]TCK69839.1 subtilase family protein [Lonepinella koalarum]TFJ90552.1 S8 family peptidase [Lonepinella koalarum]
MNNILTLRGKRFTQEPRKNGISGVKVPANSLIELSHLKAIHQSLLKVRTFWQEINLLDGVLLSAYYNKIIAKSNRISGYLSSTKEIPNDSIVGAKFNADKDKHIITHYVSRELLDNTIVLSENVIHLFNDTFPNGELTDKEFDDKQLFNSLPYEKYHLSKTAFRAILRDSVFIEKFDVEEVSQSEIKNAIVTFYDVNTNIRVLLEKVGIDISTANILDNTTVLLDEKYLNLVYTKIPYLVAMAVEDFSMLSPDDFKIAVEKIEIPIPSPTNEPVIGVIDTLFERDVYFSEWVEYHDMISDDIPKESRDYNHGTAVSSLIVDAPNLNRNLDDGCGRFQVRHFGVALQSGFNSFTIIKQIKEIVSQNTDIKVWNLSLGSNDEIRENFISAEAAVLDEIQFENDVIFIVAGTNSSTGRKKIGTPADSLNSIIVNSVDFENQAASYSRQGIVLSFFMKPDVAYYGGGNGKFINVCEPLGLGQVAGTSFAAPLIARKMAYLIHIMGLSREEAKALLIDSAIGWHRQKSFDNRTLIGNGIVPINIKDILSTSDDEIKFIVFDVSEKYHSYNYDFPVPISNGKHPYVAKATMCYFPKCSRNQGVDYTNTELNLVFGRLSNKKGETIKAINNDAQHFDDAPGYIREDSARNIFRKWDNVKHISETFTPRKQAKTILNTDNPQWGMSVRTIERLRKRDGEGIRFGVVVTLKEINGVNRIDDFIKLAQLRGWLVNQLQVETQVEIYNKLSEEIVFE